VVENPWFSGTAEIAVYHLDELLGTKLRALHQRRKGRDLFDLRVALRSGEANAERIVECFERYMTHDGAAVSRAEFEATLEPKLTNDDFLEDVRLLVPPDLAYDSATAARLVQDELVAKLPGEPWRGPARPSGGTNASRPAAKKKRR
jgi:hypothetical protein